MAKRTSFAMVMVVVLALSLGGVAGGVVGASVALREAHALSPLASVPSIEDAQARYIARAEEAATVSVARAAGPAVVSILIMQDVPVRTGIESNYIPGFVVLPGGEDVPTEKRQVGGGSGFIVRSNGLIVTNRHVVMNEKAEYTVQLADGRTYPAKVLARDPVFDLAVLKIEATDLPVLEFGDSDAAEIGQTVIAIGNALSEFAGSVTKGVISGKNRRIIAGSVGYDEVIEDALQTDAAVNPGNSGGPLLDLDGKVIGVNTATELNGQSISFAVPAHIAKRIADSVAEHGRIVRAWIGVRYAALADRPDLAKTMGTSQGALILAGGDKGNPGVVKGSPAEKAGLQENDLILKVGETAIDATHSLVSVVSRYSPGETVMVTVLRDKKELVLPLTFAEFDEAALQPKE